MKHFFTYIFFCACYLTVLSANATSHWQPVDVNQLPVANRPVHATKYLAFTIDEAALKTELSGISKAPAEAQTIDLPLPNGTIRSFKIWQSSMLPARLSAKYPELRTFTGEAVGNASITAKIDFTTFGFHAVIFDGSNVSFVDPYNNDHSGYYIAHYKRDETRAWNERMACATGATGIGNRHKEAKTPPTKKSSYNATNGYVFRTYRLALTCDHYYAQAATGLITPTIEQTFATMVTAMNRINGVYEREFSLSMTFVDNEDTLIWTQAYDPINGQDPFIGMDSVPENCLNMNQTVCDTRIGDANYDIGHVFTTGAGGLSQVGIVCETNNKAQSVTGQADPVGDGFTIDYVSHEMGHEYGAYHPFNTSAGDCGFGDNLVNFDAYEPGSGSTIMAYAGICAPDDLQPHSDPYFHSASLEQIEGYITSDYDFCPVETPTNNKLVNEPSFAASYTIPYLTPFELTAPTAADSVADTSITYCWEEWNLGDPGETLVNTHQYGPIFRSYDPVPSTTRIFPENSMVLSGILSNAGTEDAEGEKAPDTARFLTFQLTIRDIYQGNGCFIIPDDTVHVDVINTGKGFSVTSQNAPGTYYIGNDTATITWNVVGTNASPINTSNVDIYVSMDGGNTWQYHIGTFPNTGSALITMPNPDTNVIIARIKVKGTNNIFFNVNSTDFTVAHSLESTDTAIVVCPIPTHDILRMSSGTKGLLNAVIYNELGQQIWKGRINGETDISVSEWGRGVYFLRMIDTKNAVTIRKVVVD